jgi:hypothetical protein
MFDTQAKNQHTGVSKQEAESIITILQLPGICVQNKEVSELPQLFWKRHAAGVATIILEEACCGDPVMERKLSHELPSSIKLHLSSIDRSCTVCSTNSFVE